MRININYPALANAPQSTQSRSHRQLVLRQNFHEIADLSERG